MRGHPLAPPLAAALVTLLAAAGCSRSGAHVASTAARAAGPAPPVVAVEGVLADFTRQVAGSRVTVISLVRPGVDPRAWQPTAGDMAAAARAPLIITNGAGLEPFLDALLKRAGDQAPVMEATRGIDLRLNADGKPEPHVWLSPVLAIRCVQNIRDSLSRMDPPGEPTYGALGDAYIRQLRDLDAWISDQVNAVAPEKRVLSTGQEMLGYFADQYGIQVVAPTDDSHEPLVLDSLTDASGPAPTYIDMMRFDVSVIVKAMSAGPG